jgi:hypothetical protein
MKQREITRKHVCEDMGANLYGRLDHVARLLDSRKFDEARSELIELANFLPGNLVVTIGDDDQRLLDLNPDDTAIDSVGPECPDEYDMRSEETRRQEDDQ